MSINIVKYSQNNLLPEDTATQLSELFQLNYPEKHSQENREEDLGKRDTPDKLNQLLSLGEVMFIAVDTNNKVVGVLETKEIDQEQGVYFLIIWLIVDRLRRGQKISSLLHDEFETHYTERSTQLTKQACKILCVHPENPAKRVYENWGYELDGRTTSDGKLFMYKY